MLGKEELLTIVGGISITGSFLNAIYKGISAFVDLGRSIGSAIRLSLGGKKCPI